VGGRLRRAMVPPHTRVGGTPNDCGRHPSATFPARQPANQSDESDNSDRSDLTHCCQPTVRHGHRSASAWPSGSSAANHHGPRSACPPKPNDQRSWRRRVHRYGGTRSARLIRGGPEARPERSYRTVGIRKPRSGVGGAFGPPDGVAGQSPDCLLRCFALRNGRRSHRTGRGRPGTEERVPSDPAARQGLQKRRRRVPGMTVIQGLRRGPRSSGTSAEKSEMLTAEKLKWGSERHGARQGARQGGARALEHVILVLLNGSLQNHRAARPAVADERSASAWPSGSSAANNHRS
jgi:hypothetical protein